jgi:hypothetical protein
MAWFKTRKRLQHEAGLKHPLRIREIASGQYVVEWYIKRWVDYEWFHPRGCFVGSAPRYAFFTNQPIENGDTEDSMKEAVRIFIMAWQYVCGEEYSEGLDRDIEILQYFDSVDELQKAFGL